ncbi:MAG TPA: SsgA family sporulation/cell division regulator [Marmoricola sp.]|nr:SsgA family sporulation/cell division regulator [Marmoricola sp.]
MDFKINTRNTAATVTQTVTLELIDATGAASPLETEFSYDPRDPFAVTATFLTVAGQVRWTFGRDLLIGGLYEPTGDGDVHVWPCLDNEAHSVIIIELCSPDGEALVQARSADLTAFVERMTAAVAPGAESAQLDVDGAIAAIFAAEAA